MYICRWVLSEVIVCLTVMTREARRSIFSLILRNVRSIIEGAQEESRSNALLVALHAKLVTVLWIIMGLEMKSVKPLSLFNTTVNIET